jgi:hypothetical protein
MGLTNIRSGNDFIQRAQRPIDYLVVIPDVGDKRVYLVCRSLPQEELDEHATLFRLFQNRRWAQLGENGVLECTNQVPPAQPLLVPTITLTTVLSRPSSVFQQYSVENPSEEEPELVYLLVVQGQGGAAQSQLVIGWDLKTVAVELMSIAVNSLSVVFCGAIMKTDVEKIKDVKYKLVKVNKLTTEKESSVNAKLKTESFVIPVQC